MEAKRTPPVRARPPAAPVRPAGPSASRKGFSLAELLISIGILSIGLSMSAMLFPAALKESKRSLNNVVGSLICENALALGKLRLHAEHPDPAAPADPLEVTQSTLVDRTDDLDDGQYYPYGDTNSKMGCFLFARKFGEGSYLLVAVAYRKRKDTNVVHLREPTCTVTDGTVTTGSAVLRLGSPVIHKDSGRFGILASVTSPTNGQLVSPLTFGEGNYFVFEEEEGAKTLDASPVLWTISTKTGLRIHR